MVNNFTVVCIVVQWVLVVLFYIWTIERRHNRNIFAVLCTVIVPVVLACSIYELCQLQPHRRHKDKEEKQPILINTIIVALTTLGVLCYSAKYGKLRHEISPPPPTTGIF
jgi:fatty acid desaturase